MNEDINSILVDMNEMQIDERAIVTLSQKKFPQLYYFGQYFRLIDNSNGKCKWRCVKATCSVR